MSDRALLIATNNPGKTREIRALLKDLKIRLLTPAELNLQLHVNEDGSTYAENASKKAIAFASASGVASLADDSGLEVCALGGEPGLYSNRYLPDPRATDADRRAYLLSKLRDTPTPWRARFRAAVAVALPGKEAWAAEGMCPGEIISQERGSGGFGYDPIFRVAGTDKTMAELTMAEKNKVSHRAMAITKARPILIQILDL